MGDKKENAYLTVMVTLLLSGFLLLVTALLAGVSTQVGFMEAEAATSIAGYSVLGEYNRALLDQYELFFVDSSYGMDVPRPEALADHFRHYVQENLKQEKTSFAAMESEELISYQSAADDELAPLKAQIVSYMEDDLGIRGFRKLVGELKEGEEILEQEEEYEKRREKNAQKLKEQPTPVKKEKKKHIDPSTGKETTTEEEVEVPIKDPAEYVNAKRGGFTLSMVLDNTAELSSAGYDLADLYSERKEKMQGEGPLCEQAGGEDSFTDKVFLLAYISKICGNYLDMHEEDRLKYQQEFLIGGKDNDADNLNEVAGQLIALREAANAAYLFMDQEKFGEITMLAGTVAAVTLSPEIQPLLEVSILFGWAYAESLQDVKALLKGKKVPIMKDPKSWKTGLSALWQEEDFLEDEGEGLSYGEYLMLLLSVQSEKSLLTALADLMEMDIRKTAHNEHFRIDGCIGKFTMAGEFSTKAGYGCEMERTFGYW